MSRPQATLLFAVVVLFAAGSAAFAQEPAQEPVENVNVGGEWAISMELGEMFLSLVQEDGVLSGEMNSDQGSLELEGEVVGTELALWGTFDTFTINFYATIEVIDGVEEMIGFMEAGDGEFSMDFTGLRIEGS